MHNSHTAQIRLEQVSLASHLLSANARSRNRSQISGYYLLRDISFEVFQGDFIAIVGPSGAGKTTLLRLCNRLREPTSGTIYLDNTPLQQIPSVQLRQQVVLVLQESKLLDMTVQEALEYPLTLQKQPQKTIQQQVEAWIERLHIPSDWLSRNELQLSVGQRQLVAIARALIMQPKVLLLDEPTAALDIGRADLVLRALKELTQTKDLTVFMANHQLELAQQFCSRVLHLQQGLLVEDLPTPQMDWETLQQRLLQAQAKQLEEWGD